MKKTIIIAALVVLVSGCSKEEQVKEVKEISVLDLAKESQFTYLKCKNDKGYSFEEITMSQDKLISKYRSLYTKEFDKKIEGCIKENKNIDDCRQIPKEVTFSRGCVIDYKSDNINQRYCNAVFDLNFNFLNISNDIPDGELAFKGFKKNKIVFSLPNKRFFAAWGYLTPNDIPTMAYSSLERIKGYPSSQMWDLNRETLELSVYPNPPDSIENYICEVSDRDHYEEADKAMDYLVSEIAKITYFGEEKKEFKDRYNQKLKGFKDSKFKEERLQLKKNKI